MLWTKQALISCFRKSVTFYHSCQLVLPQTQPVAAFFFFFLPLPLPLESFGKLNSLTNYQIPIDQSKKKGNPFVSMTNGFKILYLGLFKVNNLYKRSFWLDFQYDFFLSHRSLKIKSWSTVYKCLHISQNWQWFWEYLWPAGKILTGPAVIGLDGGIAETLINRH